MMKGPCRMKGKGSIQIKTCAPVATEISSLGCFICMLKIQALTSLKYCRGQVRSPLEICGKTTKDVPPLHGELLNDLRAEVRAVDSAQVLLVPDLYVGSQRGIH